MNETYHSLLLITCPFCLYCSFFLHKQDFLTEKDEIERYQDLLKIPSHSKERDRNGPKIDLAHALNTLAYFVPFRQ